MRWRAEHALAVLTMRVEACVSRVSQQNRSSLSHPFAKREGMGHPACRARPTGLGKYYPE